MLVKIDNRMLGQLLHSCAMAWDADDKRRREAGEEYVAGCAGSPSSRGHEICLQEAKKVGLEPFGHIAYYLLAYTWNDVLDWADEQKEPVMYTDQNFQTKKAFKAAVAAGQRVILWAPGIGSPKREGTEYAEGPHYSQPHKWYAKVQVHQGVVVKVE